MPCQCKKCPLAIVFHSILHAFDDNDGTCVQSSNSTGNSSCDGAVHGAASSGGFSPSVATALVSSLQQSLLQHQLFQPSSSIARGRSCTTSSRPRSSCPVPINFRVRLVLPKNLNQQQQHEQQHQFDFSSYAETSSYNKLESHFPPCFNVNPSTTIPPTADASISELTRFIVEELFLPRHTLQFLTSLLDSQDGNDGNKTSTSNQRGAKGKEKGKKQTDIVPLQEALFVYGMAGSSTASGNDDDVIQTRIKIKNMHRKGKTNNISTKNRGKENSNSQNRGRNAISPNDLSHFIHFSLMEVNNDVVDSAACTISSTQNAYDHLTQSYHQIVRHNGGGDAPKLDLILRVDWCPSSSSSFESDSAASSSVSAKRKRASRNTNQRVLAVECNSSSNWTFHYEDDIGVVTTDDAAVDGKEEKEDKEDQPKSLKRKKTQQTDVILSETSKLSMPSWGKDAIANDSIKLPPLDKTLKDKNTKAVMPTSDLPPVIADGVPPLLSKAWEEQTGNHSVANAKTQAATKPTTESNNANKGKDVGGEANCSNPSNDVELQVEIPKELAGHNTMTITTRSAKKHELPSSSSAEVDNDVDMEEVSTKAPENATTVNDTSAAQKVDANVNNAKVKKNNTPEEKVISLANTQDDDMEHSRKENIDESRSRDDSSSSDDHDGDKEDGDIMEVDEPENTVDGDEVERLKILDTLEKSRKGEMQPVEKESNNTERKTLAINNKDDSSPSSSSSSDSSESENVSDSKEDTANKVDKFVGVSNSSDQSKTQHANDNKTASNASHNDDIVGGPVNSIKNTYNADLSMTQEVTDKTVKNKMVQNKLESDDAGNSQLEETLHLALIPDPSKNEHIVPNENTVEPSSSGGDDKVDVSKLGENKRALVAESIAKNVVAAVKESGSRQVNITDKCVEESTDGVLGSGDTEIEKTADSENENRHKREVAPLKKNNNLNSSASNHASLKPPGSPNQATDELDAEINVVDQKTIDKKMSDSSDNSSSTSSSSSSGEDSEMESDAEDKTNEEKGKYDFKLDMDEEDKSVDVAIIKGADATKAPDDADAPKQELLDEIEEQRQHVVAFTEDAKNSSSSKSDDGSLSSGSQDSRNTGLVVDTTRKGLVIDTSAMEEETESNYPSFTPLSQVVPQNLFQDTGKKVPAKQSSRHKVFKSDSGTSSSGSSSSGSSSSGSSSSGSSSSSDDEEKLEHTHNQMVSKPDLATKSLKSSPQRNSSDSSSASSSSGSSSSSSDSSSSDSSDEEEEEMKIGSSQGTTTATATPTTKVAMPVIHSTRSRRRTPLVSLNRKIVINVTPGSTKTVFARKK